MTSEQLDKLVTRYDDILIAYKRVCDTVGSDSQSAVHLNGKMFGILEALFDLDIYEPFMVRLRALQKEREVCETHDLGA